MSGKETYKINHMFLQVDTVSFYINAGQINFCPENNLTKQDRQ